MQSITIKIRFYPTNETLLKALAQEYIDVVNRLSAEAEGMGKFPNVTTKDVPSNLPSAVLNQAIRDAKSVHRKTKKNGKRPILKKPVYYINNQNYTIGQNTISFPIMVDGKAKKTSFPSSMDKRDRMLLYRAKFGLMRIVEKAGKWYAQVSLEVPIEHGPQSRIEMGVDLGLKVPAVVVTSTGKTKFVGNGRQTKYTRRKYQSRRRKLGKLKKISVIRKLGNKEQRWMTDQNHKISRQIVNLAKKEGVGVIKMERLANIHQTARTSRKHKKNLHTWSFYQLQKFITYKANLAGIRVVEVDPAYTSQTCPNCGKRNYANDRKYQCSCGFHTHRDRVGAINILRQPVADGNSLSA